MELFYDSTRNPMTKSERFRMAKITLKQGLNALTDDQLKSLENHPDYSLMVNAGAFSLVAMAVSQVDAEPEPEPVKRTARKKTSNPILLDTIS